MRRFYYPEDVMVTEVIVEPKHVPYDVPRGTCRSCGSGDVTHVVAGMPAEAPPVVVDYPAWVWSVGCNYPGYVRECESCGEQWSLHGDDRPFEQFLSDLLTDPEDH